MIDDRDALLQVGSTLMTCLYGFSATTGGPDRPGSWRPRLPVTTGWHLRFRTLA